MSGGFFQELKRRNVFRVAAAYAVVSWLLTEVASLAFDAFEAPGWVIKVFITCVALGFPLALFLAWAYEVTPEGVKREREVDRARSITKQTGRKLDFLIIGVLVAAVGLLLIDKFLLQPPAAVDTALHQPAETNRSVAVLPFVNMSGDKDNEYFADGISEELLNLLVAIDGLRVPSRTSSFAFKDKNLSIGEIAEALDVANVLEGSVRKSGNQVRVTAQLIDVSSDTHLWSATYDRELENIFAIQDDIATQIVAALRLALTGEVPERPTPTQNMRAHDLYLQGLYQFRNRSEPTLMNAVQMLELAVALDPKFAQAWEALAMVYLVLPGYVTTAQMEQIGADQALIKAEVTAAKALALNAGLAEARAVQALAAFQRDKLQGLDLFAELVADHPTSSSGRLWFGITLLISGYIQESAAQFAAALAVDPASGINHDWMGKALLMSGKTDEALRHARRAVELGRAAGQVTLAEHALEHEDYAAFHEAIVNGRATPLEKRAADYLARVKNDRSGQVELVNELLADMDGKTGLATGAAFYWLGTADPYFDRLVHDADANLGAYAETLWFPHARQFRRHLRMKKAVEELGLLDLWRERGWPDLCRPAGDKIECE